MEKRVEACLVCGAPLQYYETAREMECIYCHGKFLSNAACEAGHYVCDACHSRKALEDIAEECRHCTGKNPVEIAEKLMEDPFVHMHGPENHVLVGVALLTAYRNAGGAVDWETALEELVRRGSQVPGGVCGFWGCCGAAVSAGIFISIVTGATPLTTDTWGMANQMTAAALQAIGDIGGPRCCKRNAFLSISQAAAFCRERLGVELELPEEIVCSFFQNNRECIGRRCPYNPVNHRGK